MNNITISRSNLLDCVKSYRDIHQKEYRLVLEKFRKDVLERLKLYSDNYVNGNFTELKFPLKPTNHIDDYEIIIGMIEISSDQEFVLTEQQYRKYCQNQWAWTEQFDTTKTFYGVY